MLLTEALDEARAGSGGDCLAQSHSAHSARLPICRPHLTIVMGPGSSIVATTPYLTARHVSDISFHINMVGEVNKQLVIIFTHGSWFFLTFSRGEDTSSGGGIHRLRQLDLTITCDMSLR
ncbi:hypothetical protein E2C01_003567 [Portunus trituberculatus]|uniref:Uncharacterized protein n=1 Tax=Portunus trituberculatus TaxID=210409 RepID=A0A5B7CTX4_PORTR|nr:hypothetical protein [Portunus trituberculatus]